MGDLIVIPIELRNYNKRRDFLNWLCTMPISYRDRLHVYFCWIDLHGTRYTAEEITELKEGALDPSN